MWKFGWMLLAIAFGLVAACDKNSTPINESDAPRAAARQHIAEAIQEEESTRSQEIHIHSDDGRESVGIVEGQAPVTSASDDARVIEGIALNIPDGWRETPAGQLSAMRAAQFLIPPENGDGRGVEVVVFYFGQGQGGAADANIQRWIGQVDHAGKPEPQVESFSANGLKITTVYLEGTLKPSMMGPAPTEAQPGSALHGAVIEGGPRGSLFIKSTGPVDSVKANLANLDAMLRSAQIQ